MNKIELEKRYRTFLSQKIRKILSEFATCADNFGIRIFLVGGIVRDLILNKKNLDIDVIVEGKAIEFLNYAKTKLNFKFIQTQEDLNTAKIEIDGYEIDFASTRTEKYPQKGDLPTIEKVGCKIEKDVIRRDFTINSMYLGLNNSNFLELIDFTGGLKDLENSKLKVLHNKSFIDDPSRILRMLKFTTRFNFKPDKKTFELQENYLKNQNKNFSFERIKSEFQQTFSFCNIKAYEIIEKDEIFKLFSSKNKYFSSKIIQKIAKKYIKSDDFWLFFLGLILYSDDSNLKKLNLTKNEQNTLKDFFDMAQNPLQTDNNFEIYNFFKEKNEISIILYSITNNDEKALLYLDKLQLIKPLLTGKDLINLGFKQGKEIGKILNLIQKEKLENSLPTKQSELKFVSKFLNKIN